MKAESLPKKQRLNKKKVFQTVLEKGKKKWIGKIALMFYLPNNLDYSRLGIIVPKKIKKAVKRNRAKRLIKEVFRRNKDLFPKNSDIIIIPHPKIVELNYWEVLKIFTNSLKEKKSDKRATN